jgi:hypothetical protein
VQGICAADESRLWLSRNVPKVRFHDTACHLHAGVSAIGFIFAMPALLISASSAHFLLHITKQCVHGLCICHIDTIMPIMLMGTTLSDAPERGATDDHVTPVSVVTG